jgi:quercetin dioxygenase-like cupin family protein
MSTVPHDSLDHLTLHHLAVAQTASSGRSAQTLFGGHDNVLRQTLIALRAGSALDEHENPGEATVQVLHGHVSLVSDGHSTDGAAGDLLVVPDARHALKAHEDSVILLSVGMKNR